VKFNQIPFSTELIKLPGSMEVVNRNEFEEQLSMLSENYFDYKLADKHVEHSFKVILDSKNQTNSSDLNSNDQAL